LSYTTVAELQRELIGEVAEDAASLLAAADEELDEILGRLHGKTRLLVMIRSALQTKGSHAPHHPRASERDPA
jgi:hypothetical protein